MDRTAEHLRRWVDAGLIDGDQAAAIEQFEANARPSAAGAGVPAGGARVSTARPDRRSLMAEAVGYVGAALAIGALGLLVGELWDELVLGGRLALAGIVTGLLAGAWWLLRHRHEPAVARLTSVLGVGAVIGAGWLTSLLARDARGWSFDDAQLVIAAVVTVVAAGTYAPRRRGLPQVAAYAGTALLLAAVLERTPLELSSWWWGISFWALGIAWTLLGAGGWLPPGRVAELVGGLAALFALLVTGFGSDRTAILAVATATASGFVVAAVLRDRTSALVVGAVGLFVFVPQLTFELFGDAIGAPATLLMVGLLLVVLAVGIARLRRTVVDEPAGTPQQREVAS